MGTALGIFFYLGRDEESSKCATFVRLLMIVLLVMTFAIFAALMFSADDEQYELLSSEIDKKCA